MFIDANGGPDNYNKTPQKIIKASIRNQYIIGGAMIAVAGAGTMFISDVDFIDVSGIPVGVFIYASQKFYYLVPIREGKRDKARSYTRDSMITFLYNHMNN